MEHCPQFNMVLELFLFAFFFLHSTCSNIEDAMLEHSLNVEKSSCLMQMNAPEFITTPELAECQAAYEELTDKNFNLNCDADLVIDEIMQLAKMAVGRMQSKNFIDNEQGSYLKSLISQDKCRGIVSIQRTPPVICKTYSYATFDKMRFGEKRYTIAYSCCEFRYRKLRGEASETKKNAARRYATFLVKENMIEKLGKAVQKMINQTTSFPWHLNPDYFTIRP